VVANHAASGAAGPDGSRIRSAQASLAAVEKGTSLSEVLTVLVNEVAQLRRPRGHVHREGPERDRLVRARASSPPTPSSRSTSPSTPDTVLRNVNNSRHALRGAIMHSPGTRRRWRASAEIRRRCWPFR
jgi:hypothetical protein